MSKRRRLEPLRLDDELAAQRPTPARATRPAGHVHVESQPSKHRSSPTALIVSALVGAVVLATIVGITGYALMREGEEPVPRLSGSASGRTSPAANDGADADHPVLPKADDGFVDTRGGWGWGDKCWKNIKAQKWGWAKAECDEGMKMNPASPQPRASLLYNQGLIAKGTGRHDDARRYFTESLSLREHPEVRAALNSLP